MTVEDAVALAANVHRGQKDKSGVTYLLHPLRVMLAFPATEPDAQIVAVLHDVVEDTPVTLDALRLLGAADHVIDALDALTRRGGEGYTAFIERAKANPLARRVKIADITDNLMRLTPELKSLENRYRAALVALLKEKP